MNTRTRVVKRCNIFGEPMLGDLLADGMDELGIDWTDERTTPVS